MRTWHSIVLAVVLTTGLTHGSYSIKQVAEIESGMVGFGSAVCGDTDHDSLPEIAFWQRSPRRWQTWEYRHLNQYELIKSETCLGDPYPPPGMSKGTFFPCDIGDIDNDGLVEILGVNSEWFYSETGCLHCLYDSVREHLCVYESPQPDLHPDTLVWTYHYGTQVTISPHAWFPGDLDRDGHKEILFTDCGWTYIFENRGDNQNELVYTTPFQHFGYDYAFGDFDQDGAQEFVYSDIHWNGHVYVYECAGNDQYVLTDSVLHYWPNGHDVFSGNDLDQDGKPEFFVVYQRINPYSCFFIFMYEAVGNNEYEGILVDSIVGGGISDARNSLCSDIDGDGVEELLVSYNHGIKVYQATGNDQFEEVYWWYNPAHGESHIQCHDMNSNGYPDIVISGNAHTWILEVEAIRVLAPDGGENLVPDDTCWIQWQTFDPPRCDSVSLFLRKDTTGQLDTIATGLSPTDTLYPWLVPPGPLDSGRIHAIAYGPGWQYDESDSAFRILPGGIAEQNPVVGDLYPVPTVVRGMLLIPHSSFDTRHSALFLLDIAGRCVMDLAPGENDIRHLSPGVYFVRGKGPRVQGAEGPSAKVVIQR